MQPNIQVVATAEDIFAKEIFCAGFRQRAIQDPGAFYELATNVYVSQMHVIGVTGDDHAFEHLVRVFVNDLFVFEGAWFGFISVAYQVNGFAALAINKGPLQSTGKSGPSSSAEPRNPNLVAKLLRAADGFSIGQRFGRGRESFFQCLIAAV